MPRRRAVASRKIIFVGVEGKSDQAFVRFLERCIDKDSRLHLDIRQGGGGDTLAVVETAVRYLRRHGSGRDYCQKIVLLDEDRVEQDKQSDRDPHAKAREHDLEIIFQNPNLEGLLLRLHYGNERKEYQPQETERKLKQSWSKYDKSNLSAKQLCEHFTIADLRRAAKHDQQLKRFIAILKEAAAKAT